MKEIWPITKRDVLRVLEVAEARINLYKGSDEKDETLQQLQMKTIWNCETCGKRLCRCKDRKTTNKMKWEK